MSFKAGKDAFVLLDNTAGTGQNLSSFWDNFSWPQSVEQLDVSAFGTSAKAFIPGLTDGDTIAVGGPLDTTLYTHIAALKAAQAAGSSTATMVFAPAGSVASYPKISAETWVAGITFSAGVGGRIEWSASLQVTGAVVNAAW